MWHTALCFEPGPTGPHRWSQTDHFLSVVAKADSDVEQTKL